MEGKNIRVKKDDLVTVITDFRKQYGKGIVVYGGIGFVSSLIKEKLIDEFNFFVNSVMIKGCTSLTC